MSIKNNFAIKFILVLTGLVALGIISLITIPPMIDLNNLKPKIETAIFNKTGIKSEIHGNIHFSLLGRATIIAHNISVPNGVISDIEFTIPFRDIFDLENAKISNDITINGASFSVDKLVPFYINNTVNINNSKIKFLDKEYNIISGKLSKDKMSAIVRTDQHKYDIKSEKNNFHIKNKNNNLDLYGKLNPDGSATAKISITAQNINKWFEFDKPKITGKFPITADLTWNGSYGVTFDNISANGVSGSATLQEDGYKIVNLKTNHADYNLDFILQDTEILQGGRFDLDLTGKIKFMDKTFKHLYVNIVGHKDKIQINQIIADTLKITGGYIDKNGAHDVKISLPENGVDTQCVFNGTPEKWSCKNFVYGNQYAGDVSVDDDEFIINISSLYDNYDIDKIINSAKRIGNKGIIKFTFPDLIGSVKIDDDKTYFTYDFAANKNLAWTNIDLPFLPEFMKTEIGNLVWDKDSITFVPKSRTWYFQMEKDLFKFSGENFKKLFPELDLRSIKDLSYVVAGNYKKGNISNLTLDIAGHTFKGSASGKNITLKIDVLNIDAFTDEYFMKNYEELSFFTVAPITIPFDIDVELSLSANKLIYQKQKFDNFVYSLKPKTQTFSISDSDRGNLLAIIKKNNINYDINVQLNKFVIKEDLLKQDMPLNVSDFSLTAEINLKTSGKIAHDIHDNLNGDFDLTFNGGYLHGLGFSKFYASAQNIKISNTELVLADALEGGITPIKTMRVIGTYEKDKIKTTSPIVLSMKHIDAIGEMEIVNNKMLVNSRFVLRGTSAEPAPIELIIYPDGTRKYSLYEIMLHFDPEYMRSFTKSHDKF